MLFLTNPFMSLPQNSNRAGKLLSIYIKNRHGKLIKLKCEVADTTKKRQLGLMYRTKLASNQGMLFVFKHARIQTFWMKNTPLPLSIAFIDLNMKIKEIYQMKPYSTSIVSSKYPAQFVLEVNHNFFKRNSITPGGEIFLGKPGG